MYDRFTFGRGQGFNLLKSFSVTVEFSDPVSFSYLISSEFWWKLEEQSRSISILNIRKSVKLNLIGRRIYSKTISYLLSHSSISQVEIMRTISIEDGLNLETDGDYHEKTKPVYDK